MTSPSVDFDVVLLGATGFTGRLVAAYLLRAYGVGRDDGLRWAIAGRTLSKLEAVRAELAAQDPAAAKLECIVANSVEPATLEPMVRRTRVVCTTVGPYDQFGSDLVALCAQHGVDCCDLTGEPHWIRKMIDAHDATAQESGARIVNCCGFDSIPSDIGVHVLHEAMAEQGRSLQSAKLYVRKLRGGMSGGTIASMAGAIEGAKEKSVRRVLGDPYSLNPKGAPRGPDGSDQTGVAWDEDRQCWTGPFIMASVNTRVVRRTNALLGFPYGEDFRYSEVWSFKPGFGGWMSATSLTAGLASLTIGLVMPPTRWFLRRFVLPDPGEGPTPAQQEAGRFETEVVGQAREEDGKPSLRLRSVFTGDKDPGYGSTAILLGEAAVCLALDKDKTPKRSGLLTPASAMGTVLADRLRAAGFGIRVEELPAS